MKVGWKVTPQDVFTAWVNNGKSGPEACEFLMDYLASKVRFENGQHLEDSRSEKYKRKHELECLFDNTFQSAIASGLSVDKAIDKAEEAVDKSDIIYITKSESVTQMLYEEFDWWEEEE